MKPIKLIILTIGVTMLSLNILAQQPMDVTKIKGVTKNNKESNLTASAQTVTIKVLGNCETCKVRIEKAAKSAGAITPVWSAKTQTLTLTFESKNTNVDKISKAIAAVGHDTEKYKAEDKVYNALPSCCKYEH